MDDASAAHGGAEVRNRGTASPGNLQGAATLVIQTRQAQRLVNGRAKRKDKAGIIGLNHFSRLIGAVWLAASQDDPYADWYLVQVLDAIEVARTELVRLHGEVRRQLQSIQGVEIDLARSASPARLALHFATPYGYMGAYLIADYDELVRAILTAQHVGLLSREAGEAMIWGSTRQVRRIFTIPVGWKPLAVTREDVRQQNSSAQQAPEIMGHLPDPILAGTRRAGAAPVLRQPFQAGLK
jgi:integrating conjugative element protein (TIGR03761 family)